MKSLMSMDSGGSVEFHRGLDRMHVMPPENKNEMELPNVEDMQPPSAPTAPSRKKKKTFFEMALFG